MEQKASGEQPAFLLFISNVHQAEIRYVQFTFTQNMNEFMNHRSMNSFRHNTAYWFGPKVEDWLTAIPSGKTSESSESYVFACDLYNLQDGKFWHRLRLNWFWVKSYCSTGSGGHSKGPQGGGSQVLAIFCPPLEWVTSFGYLYSTSSAKNPIFAYIVCFCQRVGNDLLEWRSLYHKAAIQSAFVQ